MLDIQPNQSPGQAPTLAQTRNGISQNWTDIDRAFMVNHYEINDPGTLEGKHSFIQMPVQNVVSPNFPVTAVGEVGLYSLPAFFGGQAALYFKPQNSPNTALGYNISQSTNQGSNWWAQLPSGIIMMWGSLALTSGASGLITFVSGTNIPVFTLNPYPQVSIVGPAGNTVTTTSFVNTSSPVTTIGMNVATTSPNPGSYSVTVYYFVIGN